MQDKDIDDTIRKQFLSSHHSSAKEILPYTSDVLLPPWYIKSRSMGHTCDANTFGTNRQRWSSDLCSMYKSTFEYPELCDFQFVHEPTGTTFDVHLAHIFGKCEAVRAQVTSGMPKGIRKIHISGDEAPNVESLRTVIFFLYTGFIVDLSVVGIDDIKESDLHNIEISYDVFQLYKISQFLMIQSLMGLLGDRCIDVFSIRSDPKDSRLQLGSLLARSQGDEFLFKKALAIVRRAYRTPGILMLYPTLFTRDTWDRVIDRTRDSFMACPGVFIMYSVVFGLTMKESSDMINRLRDQLDGSSIVTESGSAKGLWGSKWIDNIEGIDTRVCMPEECFGGSVVPFLRGSPRFVPWLQDRKYYECMVLHLNVYLMACVLQDLSIPRPKWVVEFIWEVMGVRDVMTLPINARRERICGILSTDHPDVIHSMITDRSSRMYPMVESVPLTPLITSIISEGIRLMCIFRDRRMSITVNKRKRKDRPLE